MKNTHARSFRPRTAHLPITVALASCIAAACHRSSRAPAVELPPVAASIDVFPDRMFNQFAPGSSHPIEVDVLTAPRTDGAGLFDAQKVDVATVRFGPGGATPSASQLLDVDGDGDLDQRLRFAAADVAFTASTTTAAISGKLADGTRFAATADVLAVSLDPDDPSLPSFVYFANATDSRLLTETLPDGMTIDYEGERDSSGRPTALRNVIYHLVDGSTQYLTLDAESRPTSFELGDGSQLLITWLQPDRVQVTFRSPNLVEEARAFLDLVPTTPTLTATLPNGRWMSKPATRAAIGPSVRTLAALAVNAPGEASVQVTRCGGQPVNDATRVEVVFSSGFGLQIRQAQLRGDGLYVAQLPVGPGTFFTDLGEVCDGLSTVLGYACSLGIIETLTALQATICPALAATAVEFPPLAAAIEAACPSILNGLTFYCEALDQGPPGGDDSIGSLLCAKITESIDAVLAKFNEVSDNELSARATITSAMGSGSITYNSSVFADVPIPGPLPTLSIDVGSDPGLSDASTSPVDPAPGQGYEFAVDVNCVPAGGATAVLSIQGTDGYQDSVAMTLTTNGVATLFVPGGAEGVIDTLHAVLFQFQGGQILDQATISITF